MKKPTINILAIDQPFHTWWLNVICYQNRNPETTLNQLLNQYHGQFISTFEIEFDTDEDLSFFLLKWT